MTNAKMMEPMPSLDDQVVSVDRRVAIMPDKVEVFVNGCHYAGCYRSAGDEALQKVTAVYIAAMVTLHESGTIADFHKRLARSENPVAT